MVFYKKKVLVGMSGGVDSSVAALLLKKSGFEVAGAYMKCWDYEAPECTGSEDERLARITASFIKIPFYVFDFQKDYKKKVFSYFLKEQKAGRTPNPDVMCNRFIKFGLFLKKAEDLGFDFIATGHYARISNGKLLKGKDKNKDQSYFLAFIKPNSLKKVIFPLGNYTKIQVRKIAEKAKLPTAFKPDSQGICFIGEVKMENFLKKYLKQKIGPIVDESGKVIGKHKGVWFYTIGQRRGIELSQGPYYVLQKNFKKNILVVTKDEKKLFKKELIAKKINWLCKDLNKSLPLRVSVMIRYRQKPALATLFYNKTAKIIFDKPQRAITPGQIVAFYKRQRLLGGGIIVA
jgi:tRNA-specific 2-thiouridylase